MASSNGESTSTYEQQRQEKNEASMKRFVKVTEPEVEVRFVANGSFPLEGRFTVCTHKMGVESSVLG